MGSFSWQLGPESPCPTKVDDFAFFSSSFLPPLPRCRGVRYVEGEPERMHWPTSRIFQRLRASDRTQELPKKRRLMDFENASGTLPAAMGGWRFSNRPTNTRPHTKRQVQVVRGGWSEAPGSNSEIWSIFLENSVSVRTAAKSKVQQRLPASHINLEGRSRMFSGTDGQPGVLSQKAAGCSARAWKDGRRCVWCSRAALSAAQRSCLKRALKLFAATDTDVHDEAKRRLADGTQASN